MDQTGIISHKHGVCAAVDTVCIVGIYAGNAIITKCLYKITPQIVLRHFDANNITDIIAQGSGQMIVSFNGTPWTGSIASARTIDQYRFGYFKIASQTMGYQADPFYVASSNDWRIGYNLYTWQNVHSSSVSNFDHIKTGDFNGWQKRREW